MSRSSRQILDMNAFDMTKAEQSANPQLQRRLNNAGALSVLFYQQPIEMHSASGAWMHSADGSAYLDLYNNVPSVGHNHPVVVDAISRQLSQLNTNTRYLNDTVDAYLERLKATLPPSLDRLILCCTGSEANDLALRMVEKSTGRRGMIVTETAYHGNTRAVTEVSPSASKTGFLADHVRAVPAPGSANYGDDVQTGFLASVQAAIESLQHSDYGFAGFLADSIFSSDGVYPEPVGLLEAVSTLVRNNGGVFIADEVQPGFARTGDAFWGFQRHGITPDIVTMGKPMGNGYPMAGVAASDALVREFSVDVGYFNTFGGNTVAAAAGNAVLDVIRDDQLQRNARDTGAYLLQQLQTIASKYHRVREVRGAGLYLGVELCAGDESASPDAALATHIIEGLRERKILIGAAGPYGHILKVRPPLCLQPSEADLFLAAFSELIDAMY
ncbi:MAG: aspartate aminotransferase family protein [Granulosicoccus sp.]